MKKILLLMMAMMVLGSTNATAQGFLKKLKQKAENAVGKAVTTLLLCLKLQI